MYLTLAKLLHQAKRPIARTTQLPAVVGRMASHSSVKANNGLIRVRQRVLPGCHFAELAQPLKAFAHRLTTCRRPHDDLLVFGAPAALPKPHPAHGVPLHPHIISRMGARALTQAALLSSLLCCRDELPPVCQHAHSFRVSSRSRHESLGRAVPTLCLGGGAHLQTTASLQSSGAGKP